MSTTNIVSLSEVARELAVPVYRVLRAAEAAEVKPALMLDHAPYFDVADVERIEQHLDNRQRSGA